VSYTVLRVSEAGVLLRAHHRRRFAAAGEQAAEAFDAFCARVDPGIWALHFEAGALRAERREQSRLWPGISVRYALSPMAHRQGAFPKPRRGYEAVRAGGVATLLTDPSGEELYEACSAAVIAWTAEGWIVPPADRPRVASVAVAALEQAGLLSPARILKAARPPLLLLNAVVGACTLDPEQVPPPPPEQVARVEQALAAAR
jgi:hypothetical protein